MLNVQLIDFITFGTIPFWIITNLANLATIVNYKLTTASLKKKKMSFTTLDYMCLAFVIVFSFIPIMNVVTLIVMGLAVMKESK
jgi:hypothetical protein